MEIMMTRLRTVTAVAAAALSLSAASAALATAGTVGSSSGTPTANICLLSLDCTYVVEVTLTTHSTEIQSENRSPQPALLGLPPARRQPYGSAVWLLGTT